MKKNFLLALLVLMVSCTSSETPSAPLPNDEFSLPDGMFLTSLVDTYDEDTVFHNLTYDSNGRVSKLNIKDEHNFTLQYFYNPVSVVSESDEYGRIEIDVTQNSDGLVTALSYIDKNGRTCSYNMKYNGKELVQLLYQVGDYTETTTLYWDNGNIIRIMYIEPIDNYGICEEFEYSEQENTYNQFIYPTQYIVSYYDFKDGLLGLFLNGQLGVSTKKLPNKITCYEIGYEQYKDVENIEYQLDSKGVILSEIIDGDVSLRYNYSTIK